MRSLWKNPVIGCGQAAGILSPSSFERIMKNASTTPAEVPADLLALRVIPVIVLGDPETAVPLAETLVSHGLPVAEVTLRTEAGLESIRRMSAVEGLHLGAGTVLTRDEAERAVEAGAGFLVSPGLHEEVVEYAAEAGVPVVPGVMTPGEIARAMALGLKTLKFFPANLAGGVPMLKALGSVYPDIRFLPTGGVNVENLGSYLALPGVAACGGSWLAPRDLIDSGKFDEIGARVRHAVELIQSFEGK
jgi:2-dehydro-3-deoxyphosphogluconate aldolase/(4S)-4-hydroxy-2-oxoglutarate aldolase